MAMETWLRPNVRPSFIGMIFAAILVLVGILGALGVGMGSPTTWTRVVQVCGGALAAIGLVAMALVIRGVRTPRLAYRDRELLLWMRPGKPIRLPIDVVEGFLLGQAPSLLPGGRKASETAALVIRIAESAHQWQQQEVTPELGKWCEGYVTIRGTWCEPLSIELVNRLNQRLAEVSRAASR